MARSTPPPALDVQSEQLDELPLLLAALRQMRVDACLDRALGKPHGNWKGISPGQLALLFVAYAVDQRSHVLCSMEDWAHEHATTLSNALGVELRPTDCNDDRLARLLESLGQPDLGDDGLDTAARFEDTLSGHLLRFYRLPTYTARIDMTSVSTYHQREEGEPGLMQFGHSKDHRPDLRQFKLALGTLDPFGFPLASQALDGNRGDDPQYIPMWLRMKGIVGHGRFLTVGDCKMASLETRAFLQAYDGRYLAPLPMNKTERVQLLAWVLDPAAEPPVDIRLGEDEEQEPVARGFVRSVEMTAKHPETGKPMTWTERRLVVQSHRHAEAQRAALRKRLTKAEQQLEELREKNWQELAELEAAAEQVVKRNEVEEYLAVRCSVQEWSERRYVGPGRPGPNRPTREQTLRRWEVVSERKQEAIEVAEYLAGWRQYVTNAEEAELTLEQAVENYRAQWQPERGFSRFKGGVVPVMPLYLQNDDRIRGLVSLLMVAMRMMALVEFVVRRALFERNTGLPDLHPENRRKLEPRPTAEKILKAFRNITRTIMQVGPSVHHHITPLRPVQRQILELLGLSLSIYMPPQPVPNDLRPEKMREGAATGGSRRD